MKPLNFFEVVGSLRLFGQGQRLHRKIWNKWGEDKCYWTVVKVVPKEGNLLRGKAFGIFTWRGQTDGKVQSIKGVLKKQWKLVPGGNVPSLPRKPEVAEAVESAEKI
eukprot:Colp12_sorted_trinity150504_noHs@20813